MKRQVAIIFLLFTFIYPETASGQKKKRVSFEDIYRPVYGYVVDTATNRAVPDVMVYAFDSEDDARLGEKALKESRNPMKLRLKGDVVEAVTDASGRYMVPARSQGAIVFYFKEWKRTELREIKGRTHVHLGKNEDDMPFNIEDYLPEGYEYKPRKKVRRRIPDGVVLDMNFNYYLKTGTGDRKNARLVIERRLTDLETDEVLSSSFPVVRDGGEYHKARKKLIRKEGLQDSLMEVADRSIPLTDTTFNVRVVDRVDTGPWRSHSFSLDYFVSMEHQGDVVPLDTVHMYTNRVSRSLKYLQYSFEPYPADCPADNGSRNFGHPSIKRRIVLQGTYDGTVPRTLLDPAYEMTELHLKASASSEDSYEENIAVADSLVGDVMDELRSVFADKLDSTVRVTMVSEIAKDRSADRVEYRYVFRTSRRFSASEHLAKFGNASSEEELEALCLRALEESEILDGRPWEYAANMLASIYIRRNSPDVSVLEPFVDKSLQECDIVLEDPSTGNPVVRNRKEVVANQVLMLMQAGDFAGAGDIAGMLPDGYVFLREIASCMSGNEPSGAEAVAVIKSSGPRNSVIMDIYTGDISEETMKTLELLPQDEAVTWYLKAVANAVRYENKTYDMQQERTADGTVYDTVRNCLIRCFEADSSFAAAAGMDSDVNEDALKDVLGVIVL